MRELALVPPEGALRVLLLGAHPDDIEIGCFGALDLLRRSRASVQVRWAVLSGSEKRAGEARTSAEAILDDGFDDWTFHQGDLPDAWFPAHWARVKEWMAEAGRDFRPDVVLTHHRADRHQDHRLVGELTWNLFRESLILEYEVPKYDGELGSPNAFVPMTAEVCARKSDHLLSSFPSQAGKPWFTADTFRGLARLRGVECAAPSGLAEAFHARKLIISG
jgi:LmbE family N-acetylglucosaminyl deacetylase